MRTQYLSFVSMLLLLGMPLTSQAHDSLEAMQHGGSLMKLTAALLHPLMESFYWPVLLLAPLAVVALGITIKHKWGSASHVGLGMQARPVCVTERRKFK